MSTAWATVLGLAVGTALIRAAGPLALGGRRLPAKATEVVALLAPALLAALVVVETFGRATAGVEVDVRLPALGVAAALLAARRSMLVAVLAAALTAAVLRAIA